MMEEGFRLSDAAGECEIDLARRELRVLGSAVPIGGRAFEVIEVLAQSAGELVTKDELMDRIWPGAIVTENTLQVHALAIRKALGPYRNLLKTESGRGYRLLGEWSVRRQDATQPPVGLRPMRVDGESPVTNFPAIVTRLVGRRAAVARLRDLISAYRAVTLTGPGGIGKTSLALKVARGIVGEFSDGGWLAELASLSDAALVPAVVAGALRLSPGPNNATPEAVARAIGDKKLLLVLDNCEHLVEAVASFAETILTLCPYVTILATSRELLRIQGENVFRVSPLEVPGSEQKAATEILGYSAPQLFIARAQGLGAEIDLDDQSQSMIAAICRHLDGIPLAIEFAAARAATLGIEQVASGLRDRFALLRGGRRNALPRHRTMRATLDWSYQLLSEAERDLLHCLAIFVGPFSLEAACAVVMQEGVTASDIAEGIANLIDKSLVFRSTSTVTAEFRLLETTRAYAFDRLTECGALAKVAARHAGYLCEVLRDMEDEQRATPQDEFVAALLRRADEIRAALDWAFSASGDPVLGVALTVAAVPLWFELSQMAVAHGRVVEALPHAETGSEQEMWLRLSLGHAIWYIQPGSDAMEPAYARALAIAERIGATAVQTRALWGMWAVRRAHRDYRTALEIANRYADGAVSAGDSGAMHLADRILGLTHHMLGNQPAARQATERALSQPHLLSPTSSIGYQVETPIAMRAQLARVLWVMGFPDQALKSVLEAVQIALNGGRSFPIAYVVGMAGLPVTMWVGTTGETRRQLDLFAAHLDGNQHWEQWRLCFTRLLRLRTGNEAEALTAAFIEAHCDFITIPPFADQALDATIPVPLPGADPVDTQWNTPEVLRVDAELLLWHGGPGAGAAAETRLRRALEIAKDQSALSWELRAATSLARILRDRGEFADAVAILEPVYNRFTEGFGTADLKVARRMLDDLH